MSSLWLIPLVAYALGSIPFGLLIVKARGGEDIRKRGSGNIGAANVARVAGAVAGILTLLMDAGKGYLAVRLAARWSHGSARWMIVAAVAAVLGHIFPVWLRFRGGKGVATALGALLPLSGAAVGAAIVVWLLMVVFWRYVSLGSIAAAVVLPVFLYLLYAPPHAPPSVVSLGAVVISLLVIFKHKSNIERIIAGTENRLKLKS